MAGDLLIVSQKNDWVAISIYDHRFQPMWCWAFFSHLGELAQQFRPPSVAGDWQNDQVVPHSTARSEIREHRTANDRRNILGSTDPEGASIPSFGVSVPNAVATFRRAELT